MSYTKYEECLTILATEGILVALFRIKSTTATNTAGELPSIPGERSDATSVGARFIAPEGWGGATSPAVIHALSRTSAHENSGI
jgi:hypothetical protein